MFKRRVRSGKGRAVGHLTRLAPDLCIVLGRVASCLPIGRVRSRFFGLGWVGFSGFGLGFSGWVGFRVKNHGPYPARGFLWVKNYGLCLPVALVGSGQIVFLQMVQVMLVRSSGPSSCLSQMHIYVSTTPRTWPDSSHTQNPSRLTPLV